MTKKLTITLTVVSSEDEDPDDVLYNLNQAMRRQIDEVGLMENGITLWYKIEAEGAQPYQYGSEPIIEE